MEPIITINADDAVDGETITIGIEAVNDPDYGKGYRIVASNGDDIGYWRPQSRAECLDDINASWGRWDTICWL